MSKLLDKFLLSLCLQPSNQVLITEVETATREHSSTSTTTDAPTTTTTATDARISTVTKLLDAKTETSELTTMSTTTRITTEPTTSTTTPITSITSTTITTVELSSTMPSTTPSTTPTKTVSNTTTTQQTATIQDRSSTASKPAQSTTSYRFPKTECERRRAHAAVTSIRGGFVPVCTAQGDFEKVQCEPDERQCFCVDARGIEIANSRTRNGQKPDCDSIQFATTPKTKECVGDPDRGPCSGSLDRWYYDENEADCKKFVFSGCGGNGNNYESKEGCVQRCAPPPMGLSKCEKGEPLKTNLGVAVNCAKTDCPSGYKCSVVQQTSVCCAENTKIIGLQTSASDDVCSMSKDRGPCDKYELRFYFNAELKECKYFFWGGCEGNGNNFEKLDECESTCGVAKAKEGAPSTTRTTIITTNNRQPTLLYRTTQGIRIASSNRSKVEEHITEGRFVDQPPTTALNHGSSITSASTTTTSTVPVIVFSTHSSTIQPTNELNSEAKVTTPTVHVASTRAPPVPEMSLLEGSEDNTADGVNRCLHPRDPGNCRGQFVRWYWDNENKACDVFTYTGCQGNGNNYASREECLAICHKEASPIANRGEDFSNVCKHDVDSGECNGIFQRFAFDTESGECRPFTYGGCGGNGNNFATLAECRIKCQKAALSPGNLCEHDIEVGECSGVFVRFGYDKLSNDCRQFTYGGCGGNGNNFATIQECRNVCVKKLCNPNPQCDLARCQIVNDRNGCPFCSCPPVNQPVPPGLETTPCPEISVDRCKEPCIVINNRKGCKDCVCPSSSMITGGQPPADSFHSTVELESRSTLRATTETTLEHGSARPPAMPNNVGPPSGPTAKRVTSSFSSDSSAPQESLLPVSSTRTKQIEIDPKVLPPPLSLQLQEKCMQPVEPGPCKHFVDRWYFNSVDGTCHPFKYGGCAGNRNHFFTQNECEIHCARFLRVAPDVVDDGDNIVEDVEFDEKGIEDVPRRAAGVTQLRTQSSIDVESDRPPSPSVRESASGHLAFEEMVNFSVGREPIPLSPVGIGRNMERLDIDGLGMFYFTLSLSIHIIIFKQN
ncbi:NAD(P)H-quinone oxidoreductase subunit 5, chloroplastic, variant 3 [Parelaphostrongylus tenuis]|uniref:NAD(P)H-quinone oxidoreductase subunit 5, chloroplastic, variant 3 n=1 Tax=Parelaphostrongylus tenuis TaxID=148309 RepID=A0AAD5LV60_PARTN|nr:NAD(P)H-quinone oxidoreductase subunit 5, chloroplastic, variant 3 [Parelaphostrongylus tenuis]